MNLDKKTEATAAEAQAPGGMNPDWAAHPFLQGMSLVHVATLAACAMRTQFNAGQLIFREGEIANRFYLIFDGRVQLEVEATDRPGVFVDYVGAGDILGWSWLFPPYAWNFTARTVEPVRAVFFYGTWLRDRCDAEPTFGYDLMKRTAAVTIRRLHATRQQLLRASA